MTTPIEKTPERRSSDTPRRSVLHRRSVWFLLWMVASTAIFAAFLTGDTLAAPAWLQPITTSAYRVLFPLHVLAVGPSPVGSADASALFLLAITALAIPPAVYVVLRFVLKRARRPRLVSNATVSRRQFLYGSAGAVAIAGGAAGGYTTLLEPGMLRIRKLEFPVTGLPPALDGLVIAHVSDTHYGPFITLPYLERVVERVNACRPDLIVLTGDYVHRTPRAIEPGIRVLQELTARHGALAVLGNHDHWEGADACRDAFESIGIPLIDNTRRFLTPNGLIESGGEGALCIAGVGDLWEDDVLLESALSDVPQSMPRLVLSHNPDYAEAMPANCRVDLMLSGHTHGGQVWVPGMGTPVVPSRYGQKYAGGLCHGPHCPVLVSRGVGMAILPVRFGVPPEVGLVTLRRR